MHAYPAVAAGRRILIVDDIELNRTLTSALLTHAAYDVDSVPDGAAALHATATKTYDLVLMDLDMADLAGHATAAAIRRQSGARAPKLVALSAKCGADDRQISAEIGMEGHIVRPISPADLLRAVERLLDAPSPSFRADATPATWNRIVYLDLADRLSHVGLEDILIMLLGHCEAMLRTLVDRASTAETIRHQAHDLASAAGMLGFEALSRGCLDLLALAEGSSPDAMLPGLETILRRTIVVLTHHVASVSTRVAA